MILPSYFYDLLFSIVSNVNIKFEREGSLEQHAKLGDAIAKYLQCQIINDPLTDRGNCQEMKLHLKSELFDSFVYSYRYRNIYPHIIAVEFPCRGHCCTISQALLSTNCTKLYQMQCKNKHKYSQSSLLGFQP